jgi:uncharacterized Tic20 family protein
MSTEDTPHDDSIRAEPAPASESASPAELTQDEKTWGMLCHLSALLGWFAGGLTFLGPLICWLVKKDTSKFVDYHGKEALNFQLNILIYSLIAAVITIPLVFLTCGIALPLLFVPIIYGTIMPIIAGLKANEGQLYEYPATFRLIK